MRAATFTVLMMGVFLVTASAQAFPFGKKDNAGTASTAAEEKTKSSSGVYLSERFRSLDTNHDGKVSQEEFFHDVTEQFKSMDANKDSSLSPDEVDFPPGTPDQMKATLRSQMEQRETSMKKMRDEQQARMQADLKRMRDEQEAAQKKLMAAPPASTVTPPVAATKPVTEAPAKAVTYTSATAATSAAQTAPAFSSATSVKPLNYTSSAPSSAITPHATVPAKKH